MSHEDIFLSFTEEDNNTENDIPIKDKGILHKSVKLVDDSLKIQVLMNADANNEKEPKISKLIIQNLARNNLTQILNGDTTPQLDKKISLLLSNAKTRYLLGSDRLKKRLQQFKKRKEILSSTDAKGKANSSELISNNDRITNREIKNYQEESPNQTFQKCCAIDLISEDKITESFENPLNEKTSTAEVVVSDLEWSYEEDNNEYKSRSYKYFISRKKRDVNTEKATPSYLMALFQDDETEGHVTNEMNYAFDQSQKIKKTLSQCYPCFHSLQKFTHITDNPPSALALLSDDIYSKITSPVKQNTNAFRMTSKSEMIDIRSVLQKIQFNLQSKIDSKSEERLKKLQERKSSIIEIFFKSKSYESFLRHYPNEQQLSKEFHKIPLVLQRISNKATSNSKPKEMREYFYNEEDVKFLVSNKKKDN